MIFTETGGLLMITLYSTGCPKCKVLKRKLEDLSIDFRILYDMDRLLELGFMEAPVLQVDGQYLNFSKAIKWIKEHE